jgi:signal-transduction protein with cAMP-binding, CBS, and nucleotidyltransferase domain
MNVGMICCRTTHLADAGEPVQAAAERMRHENVGTLVVLDAGRRPVGIVTDRDLVLRVVAAGLDARATRVAQVLTANPRTVGETASIEEALATLRDLAVRRLPVVDGGGALVGIVSMDDVLQHVAEELSSLGRIAGWVRPGSRLPAAAAQRPARRPSAQGLQRATPDLEC